LVKIQLKFQPVDHRPKRTVRTGEEPKRMEDEEVRRREEIKKQGNKLSRKSNQIKIKSNQMMQPIHRSVLLLFFLFWFSSALPCGFYGFQVK
jgi:hypothetical protein